MNHILKQKAIEAAQHEIEAYGEDADSPQGILTIIATALLQIANELAAIRSAIVNARAGDR